MRTDWPEWWSWPLELSSQVLKRMLDRGFSEADLWLMMEQASSPRKDLEPGRWVVDTFHESWPWQVIVEPDMAERLVLVVTAYKVEPR